MRDRRGLRVLSTTECFLRLGRGGIGRVAVTMKALPAIFPVNYAVLDGDIVFRSSSGSKLNAATNCAVVAFEVDHNDRMSHTGWSVLVVGRAHIVTDPDEHTLMIGLSLTPWAEGPDDEYVRIVTSVISGRELTHEDITEDPLLPMGVMAP
jgi:nitroimidazol reductase NimA-like FMN-containing flavoprotein (pyridoxamine 5'-phosphate oxidase superfamily)